MEALALQWGGGLMLNTFLAWTLIPHCLLICTKDLQMDESKGGGWRLCGKVITRWCKAGIPRGFSTSSKGNEILIWFLFHFFPEQPPSLPILPIIRFINVILEIVCIMYVRDLRGWPDFGPVSRSDIVNLTRRACESLVWPRGLKRIYWCFEMSLKWQTAHPLSVES